MCKTLSARKLNVKTVFLVYLFYIRCLVLFNFLLCVFLIKTCLFLLDKHLNFYRFFFKIEEWVIATYSVSFFFAVLIYYPHSFNLSFFRFPTYTIPIFIKRKSSDGIIHKYFLLLVIHYSFVQSIIL